MYLYELKQELKGIVAQLESCKYECEGGPLENNVKFIRLKEIAETMPTRIYSER